MPNEKRASGRTSKTASIVKSDVKGKIKAFRRTLSNGQKVTVQLPERVQGGFIRNAGQSNLHINFFDDNANNYWTLEPGDVSPALPLVNSVVLNVEASGGNTRVEAILWG